MRTIGFLAWTISFMVMIALTGVRAAGDPDGVMQQAIEAGISGAVSRDGAPAAGVMVTARAEGTGIETTVFSGPDGRFALPLRPGEFRVEAVSGTMRSPVADATVAAGGVLTRDLALGSDPAHVARIPSSRWFDLLPEGDMKREFILNCASCHEIDAGRILIDGMPRDTAEWNPDKCAAREKRDWMAAFEMMRAIDDYNILPPDFDDEVYSGWLAEHMSTERIRQVTARPDPDPDAMRGIVITEYPLPMHGSLPHDLVVGPDGRIWITAFFYDVIWAMDPATGETETYRIRAEGAEGWGQTRALVFDDSGYLWIILGGTHELVRLDPRDRTFRTYDVGMYAHSLALDGRGHVWINDYFAEKERIGVFDPETEEVRHIDVPSANLTEAEGLPLPYGLQVDSEGRVYSTQMAANTLVVYDIATEEAKLYEMPADNSGPRRPAIGKDGKLWIAEWNTGRLTSFDPRTEEFRRYEIGPSALGAYDAEADRRTGEIWVTGALSSSMFVFDPATEKALEIPLPTSPAYTRHLAVDPATGDLWSAYSSLPAAKPKVVRIERRK